MKGWTGLVCCLLVIAGCASSGPLYYKETDDGARYYVTTMGALLVVDKEGYLAEAPVMYGGFQKVPRKGDDWDLSAMDVAVPPGHCMELLSRRPESCWNRIWELPALVLMSPVLFLPTPPLIGDPLYIYPSASEVADRR
jgi:hypothetical protein